MKPQTVIALMVLVTSLGCSTQNEDKPSCEEACRVANMSNNDLKAKFGSKEVPKRYAFAAPFVEGESYKEFKVCLDEAVKQKTTTDALGCSERAHKVCVTVCEQAP
jgi:hypothetical protein